MKCLIYIILLMQSYSPFIVKHYIPFDFSKEALDYTSNHHKIINTQNQKQEIPFHNVKLKLIQNTNQQLVLTYKHKSNKLFKPKQEFKYQKLVRIIGTEHIKQKLIFKELQQENYEKTQRQYHSLVKNQERNSFSREKNYQTEKQGMRNVIQRYKTNSNVKNITGRQRYVNDRHEQRIFTSQNKYRDHLSRLHSSDNTRINIRRSISSRRIKNREVQQQPKHDKKQFHFKIKGKKAPEAQMIDHMRRSTVDTLLSYNQY